MQDDEESAVRKNLLQSNTCSEDPCAMESVVVENGKGSSGSPSKAHDADLRLHDAVCDPDNLDELERLLEEEPDLIYEKDDEQRSPLHTLVIDADESAPEVAKVLLGVTESNDGSKVLKIDRSQLLNLQDASNYTALHYAALNRQPEMVEALIKWGADPFLQDHKGNTPLHLTSQGKTEIAVQCGKSILKSSENKSLVNSYNNEEKTPLHLAIDAKSVIMSKFLLKPELKFDLSKRNSEGKTVLHYLCSHIDEPMELCDIARAIVNRSNSKTLNQGDNTEKTALHLAAIQRLPKMTRILVEEDATNVLQCDDQGKTALHYACQNGCYPKGSDCVKVLICRKFPEKVDVMKYLYRTEDKNGTTPFMYACLNCPSDTVMAYLDVVPKPQYWLTGTYATLLYKHSPLSLTALMDKAFTENPKRSTETNDYLRVDYGPITGYTDPVDIQPQQETRYLKQAINWEYDAQKTILLHPLTQLFLVRKWEKLKWIILFWVTWQVIWLAAFTTLVISYYSGDKHSKVVSAIASAVMIIYIVGAFVNELFEIYTVKLSYLISMTNLTQVAQCVLAFIAILPVLRNFDSPTVFEKFATAGGVLMAYILSMRDIGKLHSKIGLVVEVLKQVLVQILQVLLSCAPLWIGFTLAFVVIFDDEEAINSAFPGPIVKVLVMMTGEYDFEDVFTEGEEDNVKSLASYRVIRLMFFLCFLIAVPVSFFNLLTGFALDRVLELREKAKVGRLVKQLEHIFFVESILLSLRPLRKLMGHEFVVTQLRKLNVTTSWLDQTYKFYTVQDEQIRQPNQYRYISNRRWGFLNQLSGICRSKVPKDVEEAIFKLATDNTTPK